MVTSGFSIDLRKWNARTIMDAYSLPHIEESLDCLNGAHGSSPHSIWKTDTGRLNCQKRASPLNTFMVGLLGFYECVHILAFGPMNAHHATFQWLMESCLRGHASRMVHNLPRWYYHHLKDSSGAYSKIEGYFWKPLWVAELKLKPSKCELFGSQISYLGHIVSREGIEMDPKKVVAICDWAQPWMVNEVCSFLGFMNYDTKSISRYVQIAWNHWMH